MREGFARAVYSLLIALLAPWAVLRLWRRGRAEPLYRHAIAERFGIYQDDTGVASVCDAPWVWVHAVSLGETRAAAALIEALRAELPGMRLLLTNGTATGREAGRSLLRDGDRQLWLPYDTAAATRRFFGHFKPAVGVLMETELWPNLLHAAQSFTVPMVLANARLSERSLVRGRRVSLLLRPAVRGLALVLAQSPADAARLREGGARQVEVSGNLKYDLAPASELLAQGAAWHALLARPVVLAAVTREGEEAMLLNAWQRHRPSNALLVIVPRHPHRFAEVATMVGNAGLRLAKRSDWTDLPPPEALVADAWLGDSMGELALYYASADVALLGGSFAPLGGQNLIEAAACGCPLVMGTSTFNFDEAATRSLAAGASLRAPDMDQAMVEVQRLLQAPERLDRIAKAARSFAAEHRGAAAQMARRIAPLVNGR